jgi:hypothetical protein
LAILRGEGRGPQFVLVNSRPRYLKSYLDSYLLEAKPRRRATPGAGRPPKGSGKKRAVR